MTGPTIEIRMAHLEGAYEQISARLESIDRRLESFRESLSARIDVLDDKTDGMRETLNAKIDGLQWRITALIVGTWITTILAILFHH